MIDSLFIVGHAGEATRTAVQDLPSLHFTTDRRTGEGVMGASFDAMCVRVKTDGELHICGSLTKLALSTNAENATHGELQRAISGLTNKLHFDARHARVFRLDVGATLPVPRPVCQYLALLSSTPRSRCVRYEGETVYFHAGEAQNPRRTLAFYDKNKQMEDEGGAPPGGNLLRFEVQHRRSVKDQLKQAVTLSDLADPAFYSRLVQQWKERYESVEKIAFPLLAPTGSAAALKEQYAAFGVRAFGVRAAQATLEAWREEEHITRGQYHRQRKTIQQLSCGDGFAADDTITQELDAAVRDAARTALASTEDPE